MNNNYPIRLMKLMNDLIQGSDEYVGCDRILKRVESMEDIGFSHIHGSKEKYIKYIQVKKELYFNILSKCIKKELADEDKKYLLKNGIGVLNGLLKSTNSNTDYFFYWGIKEELIKFIKTH